MNFFTKLRLNIKEYGKQIGSIIIIFFLLVVVSKFVSTLFESNAAFSKPIINRNPQKSVLKEGKNPSNKTHDKVEKIVSEFMVACNNFDFSKAYSYLSNENKEYFGSYKRFENYMKKTFNEQKRYDLRAYSKVEDIDIYQIKLFSDFLATGMTKQEFNFLDLKLAVKLDPKEPNGIMFNIGGYIKDEKLKDMFENDEFRVDIKNATIMYKSEILDVEIQNKTSDYLILKDFSSKRAEVVTKIGNEERSDLRKEAIILAPFEKKNIYLEFYKFADDERKLTNLIFNDVRFAKEYIQDEEIKDEDKYLKRYTIEMKLRTK